MSNLPVIYVAYDKDKCTNVKTLMCPYCTMENDIHLDCYTQPHETSICTCSNCETNFAYETMYNPYGFTTQPLENYYLDTKKQLFKERQQYIGMNHPLPIAQFMIKAIDKQLHQLEVDKIEFLTDQLNNKRS